jgi:hypothetical protein
VHVFEYKTKHVERQRVLPAFAHALSCTRLQSRPHSFVNIQNGGKRRERPRGPARGPRCIQDSQLLAPRPEHLVSQDRKQVQNLQHKTVSRSRPAEDWPEEGLAAPEQPILAAIADAQPIDFSAMAPAQRACPEVAEMMNSTTLRITTQAVGDETLLGNVSMGVFRPLNIQHSPTTAYHPQSNGSVKRFHRRLKDALRSQAAAADWHDHLPWVMLGIRASFREDSEFSPAEAVFGSQLILPGQFINTAESPSPSFLSDLQTTMTGRLPPPTRHNSAPAPSTLPEELLLARFVLVRRDGAQPPLSPIYDGPYRVLERSTHFFLLEMGDRTDKVSTLRLKAARTPADTEPAKPPRRGRPVAQAPPVRAPPPKQRGRLRQVTFSLPPTTPPTTSSSSSASGRPLHNARPPNRLNL